jgi:hypothetical protein
LKAAKKMQETEEKAAIILDLQDEDQTGENDRSVTEFPKKTKTKAEIKKTPKSPFLLKRVIKRIKEKLLEWWDILGEDEYGQY